MLKKLTLISVLGLTASSAIASEKISPKTLDNLQAAYNGERNANRRYLAFAKQADVEGFLGAASLFRAAARAEEIHAANHAAVIKKRGATLQFKREHWMVRSTKENLLAAVRGETYERDQMYPSFIRQAEEEGAKDAVTTFDQARAAEAEHAKLFRDAMDRLPEMTTARTFYVCPACGFTTGDTNLSNCPTCATPRERFEKVS